LLLASQAPFDLGYQVFGEAQFMESLLQGLSGLLGLLLIMSETLVCFVPTSLSDFGLLFDVSLCGRHGAAPAFHGGLLRLQSAQAHAPMPSHL